MRRYIKYIGNCILFILCFFIFIHTCIYFFNKQNIQLSFSENKFVKSNQTLKNPYRGFFDEYTTSLDTALSIPTQDSLVRINISLDAFDNGYISQDALSHLETIFNTCKSQNDSIILHPTYISTPSFSRVIQHNNQLCALINKYNKYVYIFQNGANFSNANDLREVIKTLYNTIDPNIFITVDSPNQIRSILQNKQVVNYATSTIGLQSKLGFYNSHMLSSQTDSNIYGTKEIQMNDQNYDEKGSRNQELDYQQRLAQYIPNGGTLSQDNTLNDKENALSLLKKTCISYISKNSDTAVLNKWKQDNTYKIIENQLGYRYRIQSCKIEFQNFLSDYATLTIQIKNDGFSPIYRTTIGTCILTSTKNGQQIKFALSQSVEDISQQDTGIIKVEIPIRKLKKGNYKLFLSVQDSYTKKQIHFANKGYEEKKYVYLGKIILS